MCTTIGKIIKGTHNQECLPTITFLYPTAYTFPSSKFEYKCFRLNIYTCITCNTRSTPYLLMFSIVSHNRKGNAENNLDSTQR